jgi:hypothetical protein
VQFARAHDASYSATGRPVILSDQDTWPRGGARRVMESVPLGVGQHWEELKGNATLVGVLDALLGEGAWEMDFNSVTVNGARDEAAARNRSSGGPAGEESQPTHPGGHGGAERDLPAHAGGPAHARTALEGEHGAVLYTRHWYAPVVFPEVHPADLQRGGVHPAPRRPAAGGGGAESGGGGDGTRAALLCSWKEEARLHGGAPRPEDAARRWQPVNRRRFCSKGYHIDLGPGVCGRDARTLRGDPRQGAVLLVLLSDVRPGGGGTAMVPGSHWWVRDRLLEAAAGGRAETHDALNEWCQALMRRLSEAGRVRIALPGAPRAAESDAGGAPRGAVLLDQLSGRAGEVVVFHPWLIHSGTTNMRSDLRLMLNGMVTLEPRAFAARGSRVLACMADPAVPSASRPPPL